MALSKSTKDHLIVAMVNEALADEVEIKLAAPAALSDAAKNGLEIAMADLEASAEVIAAIESGAASLSARSGNALVAGLANRAAAEEMFVF